MNDDFFLKKLFFNSLYAQTKDNVFINITIYDLLWNYKSVLLTKIKEFIPFLIPTDNSGILYTVRKNLFIQIYIIFDCYFYFINIVYRSTKILVIVIMFELVRNLVSINFF